MRGWWVTATCAIAATGCSSGLHTVGEAPFRATAKRVLWSVGSENDDAYGAALLVLSNDKLDCDAFTGSYEETLQQIVASGSGIGFLLEGSAYAGSVVPDWVGLWSDDGGVAFEEPYASDRYLYPFMYENGFLYDVYGGGTQWLQLDEADADGVKGEFRTKWWWGTVKAEGCAGYDLSTTTTTTPDTADSGI